MLRIPFGKLWLPAMALLCIAAAGILLFVDLPSATANDKQDELWRRRNLGKAFYENPTTQKEAVEEFRQALALDSQSVRERLNYGLALLRAAKTEEGIAELRKAQAQDPSLPHTWFNLGVVYKKDGKFDEAYRQFEQVVKLDPGEPKSHYNLGVLAKLKGDMAEAISRFETAARLNPNLAAPHFQLYNAYRQSGPEGKDKALEHLKVFQDLKKRQEGAAIPEDMEWSDYAEIYDPIPALPAPDAPAPEFQTGVLKSKEVEKAAELLILDAIQDRVPEALYFYGSAGHLLAPQGGTVLRSDSAPITGAAAGDFDNDGAPDLAVLHAGKPVLYKNEGGRFQPHPADLPPGPFESAIWLDYDHDYDLDLFLLGTNSKLLRNQGDDGFSDQTAAFPFERGTATGATAFRLIADSQSTDVLIAYKDRPAVLYRDRLAGKYEPQTIAVIPAGAATPVPFDVDNDGWLDLTFTNGSNVQILQNRKGAFDPGWKAEGAGAIAYIDYANRGYADLYAGGRLYRNLGQGQFEPVEGLDLPGQKAAAAADFDQDGLLDLMTIDDQGQVLLHQNKTKTTNRYVAIELKGTKNLKQAAFAEVEIKTGQLYQKKIYPGYPLHFGLGAAENVDTVRITWPNALIQNEPNQPAGKLYTYEEKQRLSGSCPMVFTWNGHSFEFISDVLGVAPLGASDGEGSYFPVDSDESLFISGDQLKPNQGSLEIRVTEELREVSYLDRIRLAAIDHPADTAIYTNEKWKSPPYPDFKLYGVRSQIRPTAAKDHRGRDVLSRVLRKDQIYPDSFDRTLSGIAEHHSLELEFPDAPPGEPALLILNGWVDWADGSTFLQTAQEGRGGLIPPYLQVRDSRGQWRTVIEDMGMPAGKPKPIVVDLSNKFLSHTRKVRIVTNLCVYWDQIFLTPDTAQPSAKLTWLDPISADLRFRGFSKNIVHPERKQPEQFVYSQVEPLSMWNPAPQGHYTRFGEVRPLLTARDNRLVIMGSGDELRLNFDARALPPLPAGWTRDYLIEFVGWAKDGDLNTAYSQSVEPLPFHGMTRYPYPAGEQFPDTPAHRAYREQFNTRPALRLLRPLRP